MTDTFDLGSVPVTDVAHLHVLHPKTTEPTGWIIDLAGPAHPETIAIGNEAVRERAVLEREQATAMARGRKVKLPDLDIEGDRTRTLGRIARRILGWTPVTMNGEAFAFSRDNAIVLLKDPRYAWVGTQILDFLGEDANFIGTSATS